MIFLSVVVDLAEHGKSGTREVPTSNDIDNVFVKVVYTLR